MKKITKGTMLLDNSDKLDPHPRVDWYSFTVCLSKAIFSSSKLELKFQSLYFRDIKLEFYSIINPLDGGVLISGKQFAKSVGFKTAHASLLQALNNDKDLYIKWIDFVSRLKERKVVTSSIRLQTPKNWQPETIMINIAGVNTLLLTLY